MDQGNRAKLHLEDQKLILAAQCRIFKGRGRQPVLIAATRKGVEVAEQHYVNLKPRHLPGRGGLEHRVHQALVARHYSQQGFITRIEHRNTDVAVEQLGDPGWIAVEVANGNSRNLWERIKANEHAGATTTAIVTSDKKLLREWSKLFENHPDIEVHDIQEYLLERGEALPWDE